MTTSVSERGGGVAYATPLQCTTKPTTDPAIDQGRMSQPQARCSCRAVGWGGRWTRATLPQGSRSIRSR